MANAKIQQSFRLATQLVTSVLESNEFSAGNYTSHEENITKVKNSLAEWVKICKEAVQMDVPLHWEEDPIVDWESTLASFSWLPPKLLKQFKGNFSWFMANVDVTLSSSRTTSESTDISNGSRDVDSAGKTPPRKRTKTGDRAPTRGRDEDWEPATPLKRSARKPTPKAAWNESAKKKKREQPVFNPEIHFWNKMKCTHCAQRVRAPERPCFSFKTGPKRCARCVFDNARCNPSKSKETGGLEAQDDPEEATPSAETPTPTTPTVVRSPSAAAVDTFTPGSSNLSPSNTASTLTTQSLNASLWSQGSVPSLAATPSSFVFLPGPSHVGGQLLNISHQHQLPFSTIGLDIVAEIQALYARARWMQENTQEMMKRIQELESSVKFSSA